MPDRGSVVRLEITSDGSVLPEDVKVLSVDVQVEAGRVPRASITLAEGGPRDAQGAVPADPLPLGASAAVRAGFENQGSPLALLVEGVVVRRRLRLGLSGTELAVEVMGRVARLTRTRKNRVWTKMSDAGAVGKLLAEAGLQNNGGLPDQPVHRQLVQYGCTDWDFLLERADTLGCLVLSRGNDVRFLPTGGSSPSPVLTIQRGLSAIEACDLEVDGLAQYGEFAASRWNSESQKVERVSAKDTVRGPVSAKSVASKLMPTGLELGDALPVGLDELQSSADASLARSRRAAVRGTISVPFDREVRPGDAIRLAGFGSQFDGDHWVTGVSHRMDAEGWRVGIQIGLRPRRFVDSAAANSTGAAGLLPPVQGLQIGVVTKLGVQGQEPTPSSGEQPGEVRFLVQVELPAFGPDSAPIWARLVLPDAGNQRGFVFRPQAGDEVCVGFLNEDPRQPVVLGAMFGSKNVPPDTYAPEEKNDARAIVSRAGTVLAFLDTTKPSVALRTPAGNALELSDDKGGSVRLSDQHGNSLTMADSGVEIKSSKGFTVSAQGAVSIKGSSVDLG